MLEARRIILWVVGGGQGKKQSSEFKDVSLEVSEAKMSKIKH